LILDIYLVLQHTLYPPPSKKGAIA
jgi:hypothetical protein